VTLQRLLPCIPSRFDQSLDKGVLGKCPETVLVTVRKEVHVLGGVIDLEMIVECLVGVTGAILPSPIHILALNWSCLGVGKMQHSHLDSVSVDVSPEI
jgi:hypothetical protein